MKVTVKKGQAIKSPSNLLLIPYSNSKDKTLLKLKNLLGDKFPLLFQKVTQKDKLKKKFLLYTWDKAPFEWLLLVYIGEIKKLSLEDWRNFSAIGISAAKEVNAKTISTSIPDAVAKEAEEIVQAVAEGALLKAHSIPSYKTEKEKVDIEEFVVLQEKEQKVLAGKEAVKRAEILVRYQNLARDMINAPSNKMTPVIFSQTIKKLAENSGIKCKIYDPKELRMQAVAEVAKGSKNPPKVVVLEYFGKKGQKFDVGLVGKGVTFDAGGISLKPSKKLWEMKTDMAGAASVAGVILAAKELKVKKNICAIIPLTENMPAGGAYKPGDVISSLSGITIEIISTDAEGRLVLADAISYAQKKGIKKIIDVATLTGGCIVALGDVASGIMGNDKELIKSLINASKNTGEKIWVLPLFEEYEDYLKSKNADIKNCAELGKASPSVGGTFLKRFIEKDISWAHIDIAGTAFLDKERGYLSDGGTGTPLRTLIEWLR